jgi:electron transfer flavoprotein alpha subunit
MSEILVSVSMKNGSLSTPTKEVLGMARKIARKTGDPVSAALIGSDVSSLPQELAAAGADKIYISVHDVLGEFHPAFHLKTIQKIIERAKPSLIIFPGDEVGLDLAARLAHRLEAGLATDCIDVEIQNGSLVLTKPVYGGKALAKMKIQTPSAVLTVRQRTQEPFPQDASRTAESILIEPPVESFLPEMTLVNRVKEEKEEISLEDARVVVSGGRGLEGPEPFDELRKVARLFGGAVGASRAAVDAGWMPPSHQVGLTGKIIAPEIYFAVAISGASQHLAGMSGSKVVVAINSDPDAPIFKAANLGVVDDYRNVIPALIAELNKTLSK